MVLIVGAYGGARGFRALHIAAQSGHVEAQRDDGRRLMQTWRLKMLMERGRCISRRSVGVPVTGAQAVCNS
jgi:uncharacterized protein YjhX (UPF0386 family)